MALLAAVVVVGGGPAAAAAIFWHTNTRVFLSVQVALAAHSYDSQIEHFCFQFARFRILQNKNLINSGDPNSQHPNTFEYQLAAVQNLNGLPSRMTRLKNYP